MKTDQQQLYRIAFSMIKGMCPNMATEILSHIASEEEFFRMRQHDLESIFGTRNHIFSSDHRYATLEKARNELEFVTANNVCCLYFTDSDYPQRLLQCDDAPAMLYTTGTTNLNAKHTIAVVGTRNATTYGANFINRFVDDISAKLDDTIIISGLATGCDILGHRRAMADNIPTVAVVAHGLDTIYPAEHRNDAAKMVRKGGMVLTDYPHATRPHRGNFLARNRIVAGLSDCIIVVESAANRGGALHTAKIGQLYNRDVFAVPGRTSDPYSGGCNMLIRKHIAALAESADDIIDAMNWPTRRDEGVQQELFPETTPEQQQILEFLSHNGEAQINQLTAELGIPVGRLMALLVDMEFSGMLLTLPGARYRLA